MEYIEIYKLQCLLLKACELYLLDKAMIYKN